MQTRSRLLRPARYAPGALVRRRSTHKAAQALHAARFPDDEPCPRSSSPVHRQMRSRKSVGAWREFTRLVVSKNLTARSRPLSENILYLIEDRRIPVRRLV